MEKKWTEGPWRKESFSLSEEILATGNKLVAIVQSRHCESPEEMRANAHLIAAAPELYEALAALLSRVGNDADAHAWFLDEQENAIKALAKARGE